MKISREGVLLIKSFEGFRSRAAANPDAGGWTIGYGHRASAREGASVSETEAELLLQYDLIPVQAALAHGLTRTANQHQYDALASFAFSVGPDAFLVSDVLSRFNSGQDAVAAEALANWPEAPVRDAGLRRRAAERALMLADPAHPVALADLLAAPLPAPVSNADVGAEEAGPTPEAAPSPEASEPSDEAAADSHSGEPRFIDAPEGAATPVEGAGPESDAPDVAAATPAILEGEAAGIEDPAEDVPGAEAAEPAIPDVAEVTTPHAPPAGELAPQEVAPEPMTVTPVFAPRYMAYATPTFGALPTSETPDLPAPVEVPDMLNVTEPALETAPPAEDETPSEDAAASAVEDSAGETPGAPALTVAPPSGETGTFDAAPPVEAPAPIEAAESVAVTGPGADVDLPVSEPDIETVWSAPAVRPPLILPESPGADPFAHAPLASPPPPLVWPALNETIGEPAESAGLAAPRLVWPQEESPDADIAAPAVEESGELNLSSPTAWDESFDPKPNVFAWRKVWAYLVMGGFGLVSLAISMAALRKASLANTDVGGILAIAGVLALIGAACVGVSAYNIYQRITDDR